MTAAARGAEKETQQRREEVKQRLQRAVLELAEGQTFRDLRIETITDAAGLSRSAFYFYYADKRELLIDATSATVEALYEQADRWWHGEGEPAELVEDALGGVGEIWARNEDLLRIVIEVSTYDPEVRAFWRGLVGRFIEATAAHLRREQRAGKIDSRLDADAAAELLIWASERALYVFVSTGDRDPRKLVHSLSDLWLRALYGIGD